MADAETSATEPRRRKTSRLDAYRHLIGSLSDSEVAKRAGVTSSGVAKYRHTHGIAAARARGRADPTDAEVLPPEPGEESPPEKKAGNRRKKRRAQPPRRTSRLDAYRQHIGVLTDRQVAEMAGLTRNAVQMYRRKNGIPAAQPPGAASTPGPPPRAGRPEGKPGRRSRIDPVRHLVGQVPDREVAKAAGVTVNAVQLYRKKYGIRPAPRGAALPRGAQVPVVAAVPAAAQARGRLFGWRVTLEGVGGAELVRIVVAPDASGACAAAATVGATVSLERIGEAIG